MAERLGMQHVDLVVGELSAPLEGDRLDPAGSGVTPGAWCLMPGRLVEPAVILLERGVHADRRGEGEEPEGAGRSR